jgi:2-oxoglutarate ferredoxin oxidoreductase subunit delta
MAKIKGAVVVNTERCKGCNLCVVACPSKVLALNKEANLKGYNFSEMVNPDDCVG